jgi:2,3-bisphosphoglycerate-independent phosphoglycerate mutase
MKGILIILDGLGDLPSKQLDGKTPLESANMPNLGFFANRSEMGYMYPIRPGFIPESDEAIVSIFGNNLISSSRGQLEAIGAGIKLVRGDLALRTNFATIDSLKDGNIIDRRAGRTLTTKEAEILAKEINKKVKINCKFIFKPTIQHRGILVLKGGYSDNITNTDTAYYQEGKIKLYDKIVQCKPLDEEDNSQYTADILNEFTNQTYEILNKHPVNEERRKKGLLPANYILARGAGVENPKLNSYPNWLSIG